MDENLELSDGAECTVVFEMTELYEAENDPLNGNEQGENNGGIEWEVICTEIIDAIKTDHSDDVEKIMRLLHKQELSSTVLIEMKPILTAVEYNSWRCLESLLKFCDQPGESSEQTDGSYDITDGLIDEEKDGKNVFHHLAKRPESDAIKSLDKYPNLSVQKLVNRPDKNGITPIMMALERRNTEVAKFLVTHDACFDQVNHGQSPINFALMSGQDEVVKEMLRISGDSLTILSKDEKLYGKGHTIFYPAAFSGNDKVFTCLTEALGKKNTNEFLRQELKHETGSKKFVKHMTNTGMTEFMEALMALDEKSKKQLYGMTDESEATPLMWAVEGNQKPMVELLLESESTALEIIKKADGKNRNVFHYATEAKDSRILEYLIRKNEQLAEEGCYQLYNARDSHGCPPLHHAAFKDLYENVDLLLKHNVETVEQSIFLCQWHVKRTKDEMLKHILEEIKKQNKENFSAFHKSQNEKKLNPTHVAAWAGKTKILEELLGKGADAKSRSKYFNWSILHFAVAGKSLPTVHFVIEKYPQMVNWKSNDDETAAVLAAENGSSQILEQILKNGGRVFGEYPKENLLDCVTSKVVQRCTPIKNRKETALKIIEFCQSNGGVFRLEQLMNDCIGGSENIMCKLLKQMPDVALEVLNQCQEDVESEDLKNIAQRYHFFPFQSKAEKGDDRLTPLRKMIKYKCYDCLSHPVVVTFLDKKWECSSARKWYILNIILYAAFLFSMTIYIALQTHGLYKLTSPGLIGFSLVSIVVILFNVVKEIVQMCFRREEYFLDPNNYLEWMIYISAAIYFIPPDKEKTKAQMQAGAIAVFMAWINFIWFFKRLSLFGIYIIMAKKVFVSLLKVLPMVLLFIFAFAMAFFMLKSDKDDGFKSVPVSMITTSVMMAGEISYREEFLGKEEDPHVYLERALLICFLVIMTIVIMNLFTGLAVGDTDETMKRSKAEKRFYRASLLVTLQRTSLSLPWVKLNKVDDPLTVDVKVEEEKKSLLVYLLEQIYFEDEVDDEDEKSQQILSRIGEVEKSISVVEASVSQVQESMAYMKTLLEKMTQKMNLTDDNTNPSTDTDTNADKNTEDRVNDNFS